MQVIGFAGLSKGRAPQVIGQVKKHRRPLLPPGAKTRTIQRGWMSSSFSFLFFLCFFTKRNGPCV